MAKNKKNDVKTTKQVVRVSGKLKEIVTVHDESGNVLHRIVSPLMVEFYLRDLLQVVVGGAILAIPMAFTEETWRLGEHLAVPNIAGIAFVSILFVGLFVYYNFYKEGINGHIFNFLKRVFVTYLVSLLVVALLLSLIEKAPWDENWILALKRVIIVGFPASLSAAVADFIK